MNILVVKILLDTNTARITMHTSKKILQFIQ